MNNFLRLSSGLICSVLLQNTPLHAQNLDKPDDNRFTKIVLVQKLEEPMQFAILNDGRVLYAERKGKIKLYNPANGKVNVVTEFPVSTKYVSKKGEITEGEDGLQGLILDPDYETNHWIYIYYSPKTGEPRNILERYEWDGNSFKNESRKLILEVPVQREECCHVGGGMLFDKTGNLYLTTGDNTFSRSSDGFSPLDERPGESPRDAQKSSGNTNDLRGKILRIHPEKDGSYTIPEGNLFSKGTAKTKPEIYTMGNRNPWRLTIDSKTGWLYWGEVGPDGSTDKEGRGPRSYDEFNQAKHAANFGWPYFNGNNQAYWDYDFATGKSGEKFDPLHPINTSPNNTGLKDLPPAQSAFIWYPYAESPEFPLLNSGGRSATGGPIYHRSDFTNPKRPFPNYFEGKWFVTDWVRGWIMAITIGDDGNYKSMERFLPELNLKGPIDMKFGPDGSLYVIEYGNGYFVDNPEAELIKIEYNAGNRKPIVQVSANKTAGAIPFKVSLSSVGTKDFDNDSLKYEWKLLKIGSTTPKIYTQANPTVTLVSSGAYIATLTITDAQGAKNSKSINLSAGNEPPVVKIDLNNANRTFYFPNKPISYTVKVSDKEDGSLANKKISPAQVAVSIDYLTEGFDLTEIAQSQRSVDASVQFSKAMSLIATSDCKSCHSIKGKSLGPAFMTVATKYKGNTNAPDRLARKIISGGTGVWGDAMMPAHSNLSESNARAIVLYILSLDGKTKTVKSRPVNGIYVPKLPAGDSEKGSFIFRAAYTDKGTKLASSQSGDNLVVLKSSLISPGQADKTNYIEFNSNHSIGTVTKSSAYLGFNKIDLRGINHIELITNTDGLLNSKTNVEIHLDSPEGRLIGNSTNSVIKLEELNELHDVYIVFKNISSVDNKSMLRIKGIRFKE